MSGDGHWPTGTAGVAHFTVRALEAHRSAIPDDDPSVARYAAALRCAASRSRPARLRINGLTLTPSGVMACAYPDDPAAGEFAARLAGELGEDAWFEADYNREIWYSVLVHFTGPLTNPPALVDWVGARRDLDLGGTHVGAAELCRWRFNGTQPVPATLASAALRATATAG